ncbi:MAG TPA: hypothetical protein VMM14_09365 [Acidimicrobiia bacterium]|nr:hypothetical protein [Acidimicrobiia bacterium]
MAEERERSKRSAFDAAQGDRDKTLAAVHELEEALSRAAGGDRWIDDLRSSLDALQAAMSEELEELTRPDSLMAMVASEHPRRFGPRVRGIRDQYDDIIRHLGTFRRELDGHSITDTGDLRERAGWIVMALRNCRNRQADLVFDALRLDLGKASR